MFFFVKIETQHHTFGDGVFVKYEESPPHLEPPSAFCSKIILGMYI